MSVSMIGVIGLQGFWLKRTIDQVSEQFDERAERALYAAVDAFEQNEMEFIITEEIEEALDWQNLIPDSVNTITRTFVNGVEYQTS